MTPYNPDINAVFINVDPEVRELKTVPLFSRSAPKIPKGSDI